MGSNITFIDLLINFSLGLFLLIRGYLFMNYERYKFNYLKRMYDNLTFINSKESKQKVIHSLGFLNVFFGLFMFFLPIYLIYFGFVPLVLVFSIPIIAAIIYYMYIFYLKKQVNA